MVWRRLFILPLEFHPYVVLQDVKAAAQGGGDLKETRVPSPSALLSLRSLCSMALPKRRLLQAGLWEGPAPLG